MKLNLVDTSYYLTRAYSVATRMVSPKGVPCGGLHGLLETFLRYTDPARSEHLSASHWVFVRDGGRSGRKEMHAGYKAARDEKEKDDALLVQFQHLDALADALGMPTVRIKGFEADDVAAGLTHQFLAAGGEQVTLFANDKDWQQLIGGKVRQWHSKDRAFFGPAEVHAKRGVMPNQIRDWLALMGDASDGFEGVPGVGEKTAAAMLNEHGTLDAVLEAAKDGSLRGCRSGLVSVVAKHEDVCRRNRQLAELQPECVPSDFNWELVELKDRDYRKLFNFCDEFGFVKIKDRLTGYSDAGPAYMPDVPLEAYF